MVKSFEKKVSLSCQTGGDGFWSRAKRQVRLHKFTLVEYKRPDSHHGELRVHYIPDDWDQDQHGVIYTDRTFMREFRTWLESNMGFPHSTAQSVEYSERGMQGRDYISMDVSSEFIHHFLKELE